jgi:hypothetical protein
MNKVLLEFTCNGHKHTFFKRVSIFGEAVTTNNKESARPIKEQDLPNIVKKLIEKFGKDNIKDINPIKLQ